MDMFALIIQIATGDKELAVDRFDHYLAMPHHLGKVFHDFVAIAAAILGDLPNRAWPLLYHPKNHILSSAINTGRFHF